MSNITINSLPTASTIDATNDLLPIYTNSLVATQAITRNTYLNLSSQPVGISDAQTLTNKTLSNTTLTGPLITNANISADTITGYTTSNSGTIYGLGVVSGVLTTANTISNAALSNTGTFGSNWAYTAFTPTWNNFTPGNGTVVARYTQIGKIVNFSVIFTLGTTSVMGTTPQIVLPVTKSANLSGSIPIGLARLNQTGTAIYVGQLMASGTFSVINASGTYGAENFLSATVPFTWASTHVIYLSGTYEAA